MPDVKSDIKVSVVPYVTDVDLNSLRKQVEDVFSKPIKIKVDIADATKAVNTLFQQIQKQQTPDPKQAAIAARRAGISLSKNWNIDAERRRAKAVIEYNSELQAALQRANQAVQNVRGRPRNAVSDKEWRNEISLVNAYHKELRKAQEVYNSFSATNKYREAGRKALNLWNYKSAEQDIAKYGKSNPELARQAIRTEQLATPLRSKKDIAIFTQEYIDFAAAVKLYEENLQKAIKTEKVERQLSDYQAVLDKWDSAAEQSRVAALGQYNSALAPALKQVQSDIEKLPHFINSEGKSVVDTNAVALDQWEQLIKHVQTYHAEVAKAGSTKGAFNAANQVDINFDNLAKQAENYYDKYADSISKYKDLSNDWGNFLNAVKSPNNFTGGITEARKQFADLVKQSRAAGAEVETLGQKFQKTFGDHLNMVVAAFALNALRKAIRQVYTNIVELDKAVVDLQVSSGKTRSEVKAMMVEYSEFARSLGTTTVSIAQAADSWLRQGYSLSEIETLITDSTHLSVLGQIGAAESAKALTTTMKGYNIAVQDASTIVDKFTTVDMNAATSAGDLATAMAECAVSARIAGVDIDKLTGYLALVAETTGDGAESVGVFFKSMFARMGNIKAGRLIDPETEESLSDVETVLNNYGIKLRNSASDWRDFGDVLDDVAKRWSTYSDTQRRAIANAFGQTRNQEKFLVLMDGYQKALEYANVAADSTGNAAEKYNAYMDGIEAHMNQLTATFEKLSQTVLESEIIKGIIDGLTDLLSLLDKLSGWFDEHYIGGLTPILGLAGGVVGGVGKGVSVASTAQITDTQRGVVRNWLTGKDKKVLEKYNSYVDVYDAVLKSGADEKKALADFKQSVAALRTEASDTAQAVIQGANGGTVAVNKLKKGFDWAALGATALNAAVNMGISLVLSAAVSLIDRWVRHVEILHEKTEQAIAELNNAEGTLSSAQNKINDVQRDLADLYEIPSNKWTKQQKEEIQNLEDQNALLETQITLYKEKAKQAAADARNALHDEVEGTSTAHSLEIITPEAQYVAYEGLQGTRTSYRKLTYDEYVAQATSYLADFEERLKKGETFTQDELDKRTEILGALSSIGLAWTEWADRAEAAYDDADTIKKYRDAAQTVADLIADSRLSDQTIISDRVKESIDKNLDQALSKIHGQGLQDFLSQDQTATYKLVANAAKEAGLSIEEYANGLVQLGYLTDDTTDSNDQVVASLLDVAKAANDSAEKISDAYDALADAVSDYNDKGFITDDTLTALDKNLPGVIDLLFDESGALTEQAAAAMGSTNALVAFIRAQLQAQITAAQLNLDNVVNQLRDVGDEAFRTTTGVAMVKAAMDQVKGAESSLADFEAMVESDAFTLKGGGGGGSKSIYSKEYEQITDLTEHYIAMSEARQKRMEEESSEYKAESRQQFLYYQQLAEQTYAEISRLRAKGYTEANEDFRKLLQNYEGYLGSMYSIAKALWEQEKQERIDNIQKQIDAENDRWEAREKQLNHEKDYYEALLDLEERYLDTISDIHTEIRELDEELATAKTYPEGSNLELFTDDEHDRLVKQLRDIEAEATDLYTKYQEKLSSVSADNTYELSHITDEFQRQYEILLKQYEVSKADLAVARARRELENVLNERNVAMLVNGVWTWVADPEAVKSAVEAVYDAEQSSEDALTDLFNTQRTQLLEETISNIELQRATEEAAHDKIVDGLQDMIDEIEEMKFCFSEFIQTLLAGTDGVASAFASAISQLSGLSGGGFVGSGGSLFGNSQYSSLVSSGKYGPYNGLLVLQDGDDVLPLVDGEQFYYKDKGGSLNLVTVGSPNPQPFWAKKNNDGVLRLDPAYTGDDDEWFNNVILPYSSGWKKSFSTGGVASFTGPAKLDGTPSNPEVVFNSADAAKLYHLVHTTPNLVEKLIGNVQARFRSVLPSGFKGGSNSSMTTDNSRKVYWNGNVLMEGHDADNFLTMLERVLPVV